MDSTMESIARCLQQRDARKVLEESKRFQKQLEAELLDLMQQKASKQNVADDHVEYLQAELDFRASEIKRAQHRLHKNEGTWLEREETPSNQAKETEVGLSVFHARVAAMRRLRRRIHGARWRLHFQSLAFAIPGFKGERERHSIALFHLRLEVHQHDVVATRL